MAATLAMATLIVLASGLPALAQSARLTGSVLTALGSPIEGARVALTDAGRSDTTATGGDGRFELDGLAPGTYRLQITKDGYRGSARSVVVTSGSSQDLSVELRQLFSQTAVVTASRDEQALIMAPASVSVIDGDAIENSAADNFADLLREVPGLNVTQFGARDINVNARGATGVLANSMLVMVDGRSQVQPFYGATYWDLMTVGMDDLSQIEILRTPATALWGTNALSGVINLRTKPPRQMRHFTGRVGFGERGTSTAAVSVADSNDRVSYRVSGSYFRQDPWERDNTFPDGSPFPQGVVFENRGASQPKFDARVDFDADPDRVWSIRGGWAGANGLTHSALGPGEFASGSYFSYLEVDHHRDDLDVKAYWNRFRAPWRIVLYGLDEDATNNTFVGEVTRHVRADSAHSLTFGGSLRLDQFDVTIAPADTARVDAGAFIEDRIQIGTRTEAVVGGRVDKFDTTDTVFAPRLGLVVSATPAHSIRVTYNRSYRAPSLLENFIDVGLPAVVPLDPPFVFTQSVLGSTELQMEEQDAIEVGYSGVLASRVAIFATAYQQSVENNIWFLPVAFYHAGAPPPGWPLDPAFVPVLANTFTFVNLGRVRDRGLELATRLEWPQLSVQASYTLQARPLLESGTQLPLQINEPARHLFGVGANYSVDAWSVSGDVHYTDRAYWADVLTSDFWGYTESYVNMNARLAYRVPGHPYELWLTGTNLLNQRIKSHVYGDTIRRKVTAGISWAWD